ncbi:MAG TPA: T9SS type A sorting domain-containing protein [Flavobacterium sp.]|jgi:hypothetical protein
MRKITLLLILFTVAGFSQQKTTGPISFLPGLTAGVLLDSPSSMVTIAIEGPADRWFALTLGNFGQPGAMSAGNDVVYYNGTTLVDARHNGQGVAPSPDAVNNWVVLSNTVNAGVRTLVATRPFVGDANDYVFSFSDTNVSLAAAHAASAILNTLQYHQTNRNNMGSVPFTNLGVAEVSLHGSQLYPNPSNGEFLIKTTVFLEKVTIYSQTGALVKTIEVNSDAGEIRVDGLQAGIYLVELQNSTEKSWKKIIVN